MVDGNRVKKTVAIMVALVGFTGALVGLAVDARDLPSAVDYWYGKLVALGTDIRAGLPAAAYWGLLLALTLANVLPWLADRRERRRQSEMPNPEPVAPPASEPTLPVSPPAPPEPLASPDSVERLHDMYRHWEVALTHAAVVLEREVCDYAAGSTKIVELLTFAIRTFPLRNGAEKLDWLRGRFEDFKPGIAQRAFDVLKIETRDALTYTYYQLVGWLERGLAIRADLPSVPAYASFYRAYEAALEATTRHRYHSELGRFANGFLQLEIKPTPPADPAPSTPSG